MSLLPIKDLKNTLSSLLLLLCTSKVIELRAKSMSQIEIAHEVQVSEASISLDMRYLSNQAKQSIKEYVAEHLSEQYDSQDY
jgi:transcriptional regulator